LGEDYHPMPAYDSDGHFCVDQEYDAGDAEAGDAEAGDAQASDASSYNWWIGSIYIFYLNLVTVIWNIT